MFWCVEVPGEQVMFTINAMAEGKERQQYTEELQKHILAATKNTGRADESASELADFSSGVGQR